MLSVFYRERRLALLRRPFPFLLAVGALAATEAQSFRL